MSPLTDITRYVYLCNNMHSTLLTATQCGTNLTTKNQRKQNTYLHICITFRIFLLFLIFAVGDNSLFFIMKK